MQDSEGAPIWVPKCSVLKAGFLDYRMENGRIVPVKSARGASGPARVAVGAEANPNQKIPNLKAQIKKTPKFPPPPPKAMPKMSLRAAASNPKEARGEEASGKGDIGGGDSEGTASQAAETQHLIQAAETQQQAAAARHKWNSRQCEKLMCCFRGGLIFKPR